jgi:hypothetical protein
MTTTAERIIRGESTDGIMGKARDQTGQAAVE